MNSMMQDAYGNGDLETKQEIWYTIGKKLGI